MTLRTLLLFVAGVLLGGAGGAWLVWYAAHADGPVVLAPPQQRAEAVLQGGQRAGPRPAPIARIDCSARPLLPRAGADDGRFVANASARPGSATDVAATIVRGKEAVAAGQVRDAELAFLQACRTASVALQRADAKYQLARHYAAQGAQRHAPAELLSRANKLFADSADVYAAELGDKHEKTRFATEGLANVRELVAARKGDAKTADAPVRKVPATVDTRTMGAPGPLPRAQEGAGAPDEDLVRAPSRATRVAGGTTEQPSFDCSKARSRSEKLICADDDLARMDRELGRLHARARAMATDRAAFQRHSDEEWREREARCRDRACLMEWYAQRRQELEAEAR